MAYVLGFSNELTAMIHAFNGPPRRSRRTSCNRPGRDAFLMDFENDVLRDWDTTKGIPTGPRRFQNAEWAALIKRNVYPHHSDVDFYEYVEFCSNGGGDDCFME
jgi:hypothetical protein